MTEPEKKAPAPAPESALAKADRIRRDKLFNLPYRAKDRERDMAWHKAIVKRIAATFRADKPGNQYTDDRQTDPTTYQRQRDGSNRVVNDRRIKGKAAIKAAKRQHVRARLVVLRDKHIKEAFAVVSDVGRNLSDPDSPVKMHAGTVDTITAGVRKDLVWVVDRMIGWTRPHRRHRKAASPSTEPRDRRTERQRRRRRKPQDPNPALVGRLDARPTNPLREQAIKQTRTRRKGRQPDPIPALIKAIKAK